MNGQPRFLVVNGPPASGKSTIAPWVAEEFGLPLISKDTIKDALMASLPVPDIEASRQLGRAAVQALLAVAAASPVGAVLESNFYRSYACDQLRALPGTVIELFCRCEPEVAAERHNERAGTRHAGHFDQVRTAGELWNSEISEPVAGGWLVIEIDTNTRVDLPALSTQIHNAMGH